jgi:hypothetical protein
MQESGANEELFSLIIVSELNLNHDHNFPVGFINRLGWQVTKGMRLLLR